MSWLKDRVLERTSSNGAALIAVGVVIILAGSLAKYAAYAAIIYGAYQIWKKEK